MNCLKEYKYSKSKFVVLLNSSFVNIALVYARRLLRQSAQAVSRERQLKEAEVLYLNLRQVVSKQPGPEVHEQLGKTQRALTNNINKMKVRVFIY